MRLHCRIFAVVGLIGLYLASGVRAQSELINGSRVIAGTFNYCTDSGSTDAYACSMSPALTVYTVGARYTFLANTANTGAATLALNGLTAYAIKKPVGGITTDLASNDIRAGQVVDVTWNGTNFQMTSQLGNAASGMVYDVTAYGAVGDGVFDSTAAFQLVRDTAPDGSIIYIPGGTYIVGKITFTARKGLTFLGTGGKSILKRKIAGINTDGIFDFQADGNEDITIQHLTFDINNCVSFCGGVKFGNTIRYRVLNNSFIDSNVNTTNTNDKYGVVVSTTGAVADGIIMGNQFIDTTLEVDNSSNVYIAFNTVVRPRSTCGIGVFSQGTTNGRSVHDVTITHNTIRDASVNGGAISVENDPGGAVGYTWRNIKVTHNTITYGPQAATLGGGRAIQFGTGSLVAAAGAIFEDIAIDDNHIYFDPAWTSSDPRGIFGQNSATTTWSFSRMSVQRNKVVMPNAGGIAISFSIGSESIIADNVVHNPFGTRGFTIGSFSNSIIRNNMVYGGTPTSSYSLDLTGMTGTIFYGNHDLGSIERYRITNGPIPSSTQIIYDPGIMPPTQTVASGGIVVADACGGVKQVDSATNVTTNTTNTFTIPTSGTNQCLMDVCNIGANTITLDSNTNFVSAANVVLSPRYCVRVGSTGSAWYQLAPVQAN